LPPPARRPNAGTHRQGRSTRYLYWGNAGPNETGLSIGRANLDGSHVDQAFVKAPGVTGIAVGAHHLYWSNGLSGKSIGTITRANADGSHATSLIRVAGGIYGLAIG
jgi:hypothetical protein